MRLWINRITFLFIVLFSVQKTKAQLNAADSTIFLQIFTSTKYADDSAFPGNWYLYDSVQSFNDLNNRLDSIFKFNLNDYSKIDSLIYPTDFVFDSTINPTYNNYPFVYSQNFPLIRFDYKLNEKSSQAYSFYFPKDSIPNNTSAYIIFPGNGENSATKLVQGYGYYNDLCYLTPNLRLSGDVFAFMKPNEDARAIFWNNKKIDNIHLVSLLDTLDKQYGLNYLIEMIAIIKTLKQKYCNVYLVGISEGGYASLLASFVTQPEATMVSGGYSVGFDTSYNSYSILGSRFDSLVYFYNKDSVKNLILTNNSIYFFTYGDTDVVNMMQQEHDSFLTQNFFNDTTNHSYFYYNYNYHTFPTCPVIDSFFNIVLTEPKISFFISDTSHTDTLFATVHNCRDSCYSFNLFLNDTLLQSFNNICGDTVLILVDSGTYTLNHIHSMDSIYEYHCKDTINLNIIKIIEVPNYVNDIHISDKIFYNNPVGSILSIQNTMKKVDYTISIADISGRIILKKRGIHPLEQIDVSSLKPGIYFIKMDGEDILFSGKILKQ